MAKYFLGVDVGGTKTHALITEESGKVLGFGRGGPGNWEGVGYAGLTCVLTEVIQQALDQAGLTIDQLSGAGMGLGGYDWPSERQDHLNAIRQTGLACPLEIVNDATLGIVAGTSEGWGISLVAGTGCNARGWSKDHKREGRAVGGGGEWSGEYGGGGDIVVRAMRAVVLQWTKRGPTTRLTDMFLRHFGAETVDELVEGVYLFRYELSADIAPKVFELAAQGDAAAQEVMRWAGDALAQLVIGVVRQLDLQPEAFEVVLIGSLHDGSPILNRALRDAVLREAPQATFVRLSVPPVVGGVLQGMEAAGVDNHFARQTLLASHNTFQ